MRIAFGSCNNHNESQAYWKNIAEFFSSKDGGGYPDYWIWGGDIVYADTDSRTELKAGYEVVNRGDYKVFKKGCEGSDCKIVGIWDDHDFGNNKIVGNPVGSSKDDEKARAQLARLSRSERKALLVDFLGEPTKSEVLLRKNIRFAPR